MQFKRVKEKNPGFVYIISDGTNIKVGVANNVNRRLKSLQTGNPNTLTLEFSEYRNQPYKLETYLHQQLAKYRTKGEWYHGITVQEIRVLLLLYTDYD